MLHVVNLDKADANGAVLAADNRGVGTRLEVLHHDRGFARIAWLQTGRFDFGFLARLPVVVRGDNIAVAIMDLEGWILHRLRNVKRGEGWSEGPEDDAGDSGRLGAGKESADENVVVDADEAAG